MREKGFDTPEFYLPGQDWLPQVSACTLSPSHARLSGISFDHLSREPAGRKAPTLH
jgi:hypothetical protein